jgi:hypothetical protein
MGNIPSFDGGRIYIIIEGGKTTFTSGEIISGVVNVEQ